MTLYNEVMKHTNIIEQGKEIQKQRKDIKSHLDLLNLEYNAKDVTLIREKLSKDYKHIDVAVAYSQIRHK